MIEWTDSEVKLKRHTAYRKQSGRTRSTEWKWAWKINRRMKESREWRQSDSGDEAAGWRQTEPNKKNERQQKRQPHTADVFVWTPANSRTNKRIPVMKSKILFIRDFFFSFKHGMFFCRSSLSSQPALLLMSPLLLRLVLLNSAQCFHCFFGFIDGVFISNLRAHVPAWDLKANYKYERLMWALAKKKQSRATRYFGGVSGCQRYFECQSMIRSICSFRPSLNWPAHW